MSTTSLIIIAVLIGIIVWIILAIRGVLGPWKKEGPKWNRKEAEKKAREDWNKKNG